MFDFIKVFRKTWAEFYKDKLEAKRLIDDMKDKLFYYANVERIFREFKDVIYKDTTHRVFPTKEKCGAEDLTAALNFLMYGIKTLENSLRGAGYVSLIKEYHVEELKRWIIRARMHYRRRDFEQVKRAYNEYRKSCAIMDKKFGTSSESYCIGYEDAK